MVCFSSGSVWGGGRRATFATQSSSLDGGSINSYMTGFSSRGYFWGVKLDFFFKKNEETFDKYGTIFLFFKMWFIFFFPFQINLILKWPL